MASTIKIAIIDDRLCDLELITHAVQRINGCSIILKHTRPMQFFEHLMESTQIPDVLITDCQMPEIDGMALTRLVHLFLPQVKTMVVSGLLSELDVAELLDIGASAIVAKGSLQIAKNNTLQMAIAAVTHNKIFIDPIWEETLVQNTFNQLQKKKEHRQTPDFSEHEQKIIQLLATHHQYKTIAQLMHLSHRTVETHVKKIAEKAGTHNKAQIIAYGIKNFFIRVFRG
ncbi:response regulator transcription factor [Hydrotalea flava]|uniref:response regulator transcription factor n=1 Tax=Hydrotalea flava TaxID=714549 RepID=UPI000834E807|nr:response regulator transcription factor [Hydrotalea flava]